MKKVTVELCAEYIDWREMLDKLNEVVSDTAKEISNLDITYSENDE